MRLRAAQAVKAIGAGVLGAILAVSAVLPAAAAPEIELSSDGVTYAAALPAPLFSGAGQLIPMGSVQRTFWIRNAAADSAYLSLTLIDQSWSDQQFADGLTVTSTAAGESNGPIRLSTTASCAVLADGILIAPGQAIAVSTTLSLGNLSGSDGQDAVAALSLGVLLTQAAGPASAATCSTPPVVVPVIPAPPPGRVPGAAPPTDAAEPDEPAVQPEVDDDDGPTTPIEELGVVLTNTLARFDATLVGFSALAIPAGATLFYFLVHRRQDEDDVMEEGHH